MDATVAFFALPVAIMLFYVTAKKNLTQKPWGFWRNMFLIAISADILSTLYCIYIIGIPWERENNYYIQKLAQVLDYKTAFALFNLLVITIACAAGYLAKLIHSSIAVFIYFVLIISFAGAAFHNTILGTIEFFILR